MAASSKSLGLLHEVVQKALTERLEAENEGLQDGIIPNASTINAAIMFLKHNEITCAPDEDTGMSDFSKLIEQRRAAQKEALRKIPVGQEYEH